MAAAVKEAEEDTKISIVVWDLRFSVLVMKSNVFWDIMLCSPFKVNLHFGGT
jgi:hypothetical protein